MKRTFNKLSVELLKSIKLRVKDFIRLQFIVN
ncbi:hypothetical protein JL09_g6684 [Pichia kudriavzevii]|uniref:Uncharacterized protein n=1 Tax=Pichia kudriavzevii TaxID=4909 RepID=A0A099NKT4_PICKU|nr:hypothetical protein JL09_g6684 [Pichia kudriavzevii]